MSRSTQWRLQKIRAKQIIIFGSEYLDTKRGHGKLEAEQIKFSRAFVGATRRDHSYSEVIRGATGRSQYN
jgi:hypothetical protein